MALLQLFKNLPFDGEQNLPSFDSLTSQNAYFSVKEKYEVNINYNKIGSPITISGVMDDLTEYSYGRIKVNSKWYYIIIDNLIVIESGKMQMHYRIDSWTTYFYQNGLSVSSGHIYRAKSFGRKTFQQPISVKEWRVSNILPFGDCMPSAFVSYIKNNDVNYACLSDPSTADNISWITSELQCTPQDVLGVWLSPIRFNAMPFGTTVNNQMLLPSFTMTLSNTYETTETTKYVFADAFGNAIFTAPYKKPFSSYKMSLLMSANTCKIEVELNPTSDRLDKPALEGMRFYVMCDSVDVVIDKYQQYAKTQREYDINSRQLQSQHSLVKGLLNTGMSGLSGGMQGAVMGNPVLGAGIGAGMNVATAGIGYGLEVGILNNEIQAVMDRQYELMQDEIKNFGGCISRYSKYYSEHIVYNENYPFVKLVEIKADVQSIMDFNADIYYNGSYFDEVRAGSEIEFDGALKGDLIIVGNAPMLDKQAIKTKIANGVYFKRL